MAERWDGLDAAMRRLEAALDALEAALQRRRAGEHAAAGLRGELQLLAGDRARLAEQLDFAHERVTALEAANQEASHRLAAAMETIRVVIEAEGG